MTKKRWISVWHQLDEVIRLEPKSVLEVGVGSGIFRSSAAAFGISVETLDIAVDLEPDYLAPANAMPLSDKSFDVVCAFQILEHMPFEMALESLRECCRVARRAVIVSLPDAKTLWPQSITIPKYGLIQFF